MAITLVNNGWLSVPWAEYVSRQGTTLDAALSYDSGCTAAYTIQVNWSDLNQAITDLVGVNRWDKPTKQLVRVPPARHPHFRWLYCSGISSVRPVRWDRKTAGPRGAVSEYELALITAKFTQPRWNRTLSDNDLQMDFGRSDEWERFCTHMPTSAVETLTLLPSEMLWAETSATGPKVGDSVTIPLGQRVRVLNLQVIWHRVPRNGPVGGLFDKDDNLPTNLLAAIETVNDATFMGYPAETLLFKGYRFQPVDCPEPDRATEAADSRGNYLMYDVVLDFLFRDPTAGGATRGWNLGPNWPDQRWYRLKSKKDATRALLEASDFKKLFAMAGT